MVREARFSWDDTDGFEPPIQRDGFDDDEAEDLLDPLPPQTNAPKRDKPPRRRNGGCARDDQPPPDRESESHRRHLAGADWLSEPGDERPA